MENLETLFNSKTINFKMSFESPSLVVLGVVTSKQTEKLMPQIVKVVLVGGVLGGLLGFGLSIAGAPLWVIIICSAVLGWAIGITMSQ